MYGLLYAADGGLEPRYRVGSLESGALLGVRLRDLLARRKLACGTCGTCGACGTLPAVAAHVISEPAPC